jgi:thioredoxin reductase (NADPH)
MTDRPVVVVGGGNSAGQAAIHLSKYAATVTLLVRGESLAASMSDYLIQQLRAATNITTATALRWSRQAAINVFNTSRSGTPIQARPKHLKPRDCSY